MSNNPDSFAIDAEAFERLMSVLMECGKEAAFIVWELAETFARDAGVECITDAHMRRALVWLAARMAEGNA